MSISEQVKELREYTSTLYITRDFDLRNMIIKAADTIEILSAKLADMERPKANYSVGDLSELIEKFDNENIKGLTDFEHTQIFNALVYLDMYQRIGTIDKFMELKQNVKRSAEDCGGWIPCSERLPKEGVDVLVWYEYFRYGEYNRLFQTKGISYTYNGKWSGFVNGQSGWHQLSIIAWQPMPEDYHEP